MFICFGWLTLVIVACSSKERCASTSVDTNPGTTLRISTPKLTQTLSTIRDTKAAFSSSDRAAKSNAGASSSTLSLESSSSFFLLFLAEVRDLGVDVNSLWWAFPQATASSMSFSYSGRFAAWRINEGLVVASSGEYYAMSLKSPVSATTVVNSLS